MKRKLHISVLPIIFCTVIIVIDIFALSTGLIKKSKTKQSEVTEPLLIDFKTDFKERIKSVLPDESEGLALGYLLGDKSELNTSLKEIIAAVGLTHLVVASGAHLGIILKFMKKSFGKISRIMGLLSALMAVGLFIGIIGLTPSALRAGLVAILSLFATYFGRDLKPGRLILYVAAITIMINPFYPIELSWLLSFASFSAILILAPEMERYFYGSDKKPGVIAGLLIASISATLLTAPILLFYFGQISLISVLANILISPTLAITMFFTFLTGLLPNAATAFLTHFLVQYHINVATVFSEQTAFLVNIEKNNPWVFLIYLPVLLVFIYFKRSCRLSLRNNTQRKPPTSGNLPAEKSFSEFSQK